MLPGGIHKASTPTAYTALLPGTSRSLPIEFVRVLRIRRQENIEGRRVLNLGGQHRRGCKTEDWMDFGLRFEFRADGLSDFGEIGRGGDCDLAHRLSEQQRAKRYDDQQELDASDVIIRLTMLL